MWSTIFVQEDERPMPGVTGVAQAMGVVGPGGRKGGGAKRRGGGGRRVSESEEERMSEGQEGKIKLAFFLALVGVALTVLGVGTEFWAELSPSKMSGDNRTCVMAHYGLWKRCLRTLWVSDVHPDRDSCGPAELPGESNCTFFKFFTTGENAVLFHKTTVKSLNLAAAMLALFSLFFMVMGAICITMSLSKGVLFFLKPASVCFSLSGVLVFLSLIVFHRSVLALLASDPSVPLQHQLSWSVSCMGCAGAILLLGGLCFLLLALPYSPWDRCLPRRGGAS